MIQPILFLFPEMTFKPFIDGQAIESPLFIWKLGMEFLSANNFMIKTSRVLAIVTVRAPGIRKMVIGGRKVAQIPFTPSCRGTHWKLENQCLVNFKSCKSVEIMGCILLHMTFYYASLKNEGAHTKLVISLLLLVLHH